MNINLARSITAVIVAFVMVAEPCAGTVPVEAYKSYIRGLLAARAGNAEQALNDYQRTADLDKNAVYVYKDIAFSLWQAGKAEEALLAAKKLEQSYGDNLPVLLFLGSFYMLAGEPAAARASWEKALSIDPDNETAVLYLAAFHASGNEPEKAVSYWNQFLRSEPDSAQAYYQLGLSHERLGDIGKAKESYEHSLALNPDIPEAHLSMAQLYEKEEKSVAAAQEYEQYLELAPDNLTVMLYLGGLYYRLKNYDAAENTFSKAFLINPSDVTVCFWLGVISEEKKDWTNAVKYFKIIAQTEKTPPVLLRLSYYYSALRDYKNALKCLNEVVKLEPGNAVSYYMLGLAYFDMNKLGLARKNLIKANELSPELGGVSFHLGVIYDQQRRFDEAVAAFEKEIKVNPDYAPALNYLGYSYADKGIKLDEAEVLVKRALEVEPENGSYLDSLGWVYFRKGIYDKAEKYLMLASTKFRDAVIFEHLGDLYAKQNRILDAWNAYRKALDLDNKNKSANKKIKEMEKLVLPSTLQRKALKRAVGNLRQLSSLKAGFTATGRASGINFRFAGFFQYSRPELWRIDVLGNFLAPQAVIIQNNGIKLYPEVLSQGFSGQKADIFDRIKKYFNTELFEEFDSDKTLSERRGNKYYYRQDEKLLVINSKNGTAVEFRPEPGVIIKFRDYSIEEGLYIPVNIDVYSGGDNINANVRLKNCTVNQPINKTEFSIEGN